MKTLLLKKGWVSGLGEKKREKKGGCHYVDKEKVISAKC